MLRRGEAAKKSSKYVLIDDELTTDSKPRCLPIKDSMAQQHAGRSFSCPDGENHVSIAATLGPRNLLSTNFLNSSPRLVVTKTRNSASVIACRRV